MSKSRGVRFTTEQWDAIQEMVEEGLADNPSEAVDMVMNVGLTQYGKLYGGTYDSSLRQYVRLAGYGTACMGVFAVALTFFMSLELRLFATIPWVMAVTFYSLDKGLARVEPHVSRRMGLLEREKA